MNSRRKSGKISTTCDGLLNGRYEIQGPNRDLLIAAEMGNISELKRLMGSTPRPDLTCEDANGRTAFMIALERDDVDLVEYLVPFGDDLAIANLLLEAISEKKETIACTILKNMKDEQRGVNLMKQLQMEKQLDGDNTGIENQDVTPMMAASQRNLYEVVRSLHDRGETIDTPHPYRCICEQCVTQSTFDQLRFAQRRLNAYKAITSDSYLSIVSDDPINDAFLLSGLMKDIAMVEKHFKAEYMALSENLSVYLFKLLDRVRDQSELESILNRVDRGDPNIEDEEPLARIKMAIDYEEKKFVAHPSCQMKLVALWYSGAGFLEKGSKWSRMLYFLCLMVIHPFCVPLYIFAPNHKWVTFLRAPVIKFCAQTVCFMVFLGIIISWSFNTGSSSSNSLDLRDHHGVNHLFKRDLDNEGQFIMRRSNVSLEEYLILIWVIGMLWREIQQIFDNGITEHFRSLFNVLDFSMIVLYFSSLALRTSILMKVQESLMYFANASNFELLAAGNETAQYYYYWLNADRFYWDSADPHHVAEGIFAIANVLTFSRVSYILPVNELLGPLQISLGRMMYDISKFTVIFLMVFIAFLIGLDNLFWYYNNDNRVMVELYNHTTTEAGQSFGSFGTALSSVFWALFGMTSQKSVNVEPYDATFTQNVASLLFGAYEVSIVIVLLNMLIAMMSSSFEQIEQESDVEWKFARSKLYLEFIEEGNVLPAPLNLLDFLVKPIGIVIHIIRWLCFKCCGKKKVKKPTTIVRRGTYGDVFKAEARTRKMAAFKDTNSDMTVVYNKSGVIEPVVAIETPQPVTYREVVCRVVERFIFDVTSGDEAEANEGLSDDLADMRQDITRMRRDVINAMSVQERELQGMRGDLAELTTILGTSVKNTEKRVAECQRNISKLTEDVQKLNRTQEEGLHMYLAITERVFHSLNTVSNHILKQNVAPDSPLTHILSFRKKFDGSSDSADKKSDK